MTSYTTPFMDEWPTVSFDAFEDIEIKNPVGKVCYKSFFVFMRIPKIILSSFYTLLIEDVN